MAFRTKKTKREGSSVSVSATSAVPDIRHEVWALAWPTIIANVLMNAGSLINVYFVHGLGVRAMETVAWGEQMIGFVFAIAAGISVGTTAIVARSIGAGDEKDASVATRQSLLFGVLLGCITTGLLYVLGKPLLVAMGADARSLPLGLAYYHVLLLGVVPFFIINVSGAAFRGAGDTRTPLYLLMLLVFVNIATDATFIWGFGPIPAMGVLGAGYGTLIMRCVGVAAFLFALSRSPRHLLTAGDTWVPSLAWFGRLTKVGIPASVQAGLRNVAGATYIGLLGRMAHGPAVVAAMSVGMRAEGLAYMPGMAFNVAAAALVGQNLGANNPNRAHRAARAATLQSIWVMSAMGAAFYIFAEPIARALSAPEAVPYTISYLRIASISEPLLAVSMTLTGALQGAGDTTRPMWTVIFTMWGLRLPLTWYFGLKLGYGADAAWWAMTISVWAQGLLMLAAWRRGTWRRVRV